MDFEKNNWDLESLLEGKTLETNFNNWIELNENLAKIFFQKFTYTWRVLWK